MVLLDTGMVMVNGQVHVFDDFLSRIGCSKWTRLSTAVILGVHRKGRLWCKKRCRGSLETLRAVIGQLCQLAQRRMRGSAVVPSIGEGLSGEILGKAQRWTQRNRRCWAAEGGER